LDLLFLVLTFPRQEIERIHSGTRILFKIIVASVANDSSDEAERLWADGPRLSNQ
jgi:hypothetical protein